MSPQPPFLYSWKLCSTRRNKSKQVTRKKKKREIWIRLQGCWTGSNCSHMYGWIGNMIGVSTFIWYWGCKDMGHDPGYPNEILLFFMNKTSLHMKIEYWILLYPGLLIKCLYWYCYRGCSSESRSPQRSSKWSSGAGSGDEISHWSSQTQDYLE